MSTPSILRALLAFVHGLFRSWLSQQIEILALRHQLAGYERSGARPRLRPTDRLLRAWLPASGQGGRTPWAS